MLSNMSGLLERFLVSLSLAILDKLVVKGTAEFQKYMDFKKAMADAEAYQKVVDKPEEASREDRRKSEDDLLS